MDCIIAIDMRLHVVGVLICFTALDVGDDPSFQILCHCNGYYTVLDSHAFDYFAFFNCTYTAIA